jgi:hypothetical protein
MVAFGVITGVVTGQLAAVSAAAFVVTTRSDRNIDSNAHPHVDAAASQLIRLYVVPPQSIHRAFSVQCDCSA